MPAHRSRLVLGLLMAALSAAVPRTTRADSYTLTTLATFNGTNGKSPGNGYLLADGGGNLYGTAADGGTHGYGTVFKLAAGSSTITTLASFDGDNGALPVSGLATDTSGNLYGTTSRGTGGPLGRGTVFKIAAGTGTLTTLAQFDGTNGNSPIGTPTVDASGNLYGTTYYGSQVNAGSVFKIAAGTGTLSTVAEFDGTNGSGPWAGLLADADGNLYGTTEDGGANGLGTVFKIAAGSSTITTLASFDGANGDDPVAGLIADTSGNLYGTTQYGGANSRGTVFKIAAGTGTITTLASFDGPHGANPRAGLLLDADGNLFGTTSVGGAFGRGTVFELAADSNAITTLVSFDGSNGAFPVAGLIADADGNLYGTTIDNNGFGSNFGNGRIFKLSPVPEPSTLALGMAAASGILMLRRRLQARSTTAHESEAASHAARGAETCSTCNAIGVALREPAGGISVQSTRGEWSPG